LQRIYEIPDGEEKRTLIILFDLPPAFFRQVQDIESTHNIMLYWNNWQTWLRQTNVLNDADRNPVAIKPVMLQNERAVIDIGTF
jgi:RNA-dependent RNA polymerase